MPRQSWWEKGEKPPVPTPDQAEAIASHIGEAMSVVHQQLAPVFDAADGIRSQLLARGYSETAAEQAALQHIMLAQAAMWSVDRG